MAEVICIFMHKYVYLTSEQCTHYIKHDNRVDNFEVLHFQIHDWQSIWERVSSRLNIGVLEQELKNNSDVKMLMTS